MSEENNGAGGDAAVAFAAGAAAERSEQAEQAAAGAAETAQTAVAVAEAGTTAAAQEAAQAREAAESASSTAYDARQAVEELRAEVGSTLNGLMDELRTRLPAPDAGNSAPTPPRKDTPPEQPKEGSAEQPRNELNGGQDQGAGVSSKREKPKRSDGFPAGYWGRDRD